MPDRIRVGQIVGTHGLKGHVKVDLLTDFPQRLEEGARVFVGGEWREVVECRWHKGRPMLLLSGIHNIGEAEPLKWQFIESIAERPKLEEGEFFIEDLLGCEVVTTAGERLGVVDDVLSNPAHDILEVDGILIPIVKQFVKKIDLGKKRIEVELIEGMRE